MATETTQTGRSDVIVPDRRYEEVTVYEIDATTHQLIDVRFEYFFS